MVLRVVPWACCRLRGTMVRKDRRSYLYRICALRYPRSETSVLRLLLYGSKIRLVNIGYFTLYNFRECGNSACIQSFSWWLKNMVHGP